MLVRVVSWISSVLRKKFGLNRIEAEDLAHSRETAPVNRNGAKFLQGPAMFRRWITFVRSEAIAAVERIHFQHMRVPGCLGDN